MDASTARAKADLLNEQVSDLQSFITDANAFTRETASSGCYELFNDGPFQGKTWIEVVLETNKAQKVLPRLRREANEAAFKAMCLENIASTGQCYLSVGGTDCDSSSFGYARAFDSFDAAIEYRDGEYESADGPMYISAISKEEYDQFQSYSHDLALVASENGHPHSVSEADWDRSR